jgi:16S rRNA processing protein RimM
VTRPEWIEVGRISRAHGVRGELRVTPTSDNPERFAPGGVVYARSERVGLAGPGPRLRGQVRLTICTVRGEGSFPIVAFEGVDDRGAAEALRGCILEIPSEQLPELDDEEFYPFDIIDLEVRDGEGAVRGRVVDVVETPAHDLLVIAPLPLKSTEEISPEETSSGEALVPFVAEAVPTVSVADGYLVVTTRFLESF